MSRSFYSLAVLLCLYSSLEYLEAQTAPTTISDTIIGPNGSNPSGTAIISWTRFENDASPARQTVYPGSLTIQVTNGAFSVALFPSAAALPTNFCYQIAWNLAGIPSTRYWFVPVSATPVTLNQVESSIGCTPGTAPIVAPAQINPGPGNTVTVLTSNGTGAPQWLPGGGSGGSPAFSAILSGVNSGQTMTVGPSSVMNYSSNGIVDANQILGTTITSLYGSGGALMQGSGTFTSGHLPVFGSGGNTQDSGIVAANVLVSTGAYANPAWITSISASVLSGALGCGALPALTGDATNTGCAIAVSKTGGVAFAPSATLDTTIASNILTGTLAAARLPAINLGASGAGGVTGNLQAVNVGGGTGCSTGTWIRGDMTCQTIGAGGTVTNSFGPLTAGAVVIGNGANDETVLSSLGTTSLVLTGNATGSPSWAQVNLATTVSGILGGANGGTANGFFAISGPAGSLKTFTLPNASAAILTNNAAVTLGQGGLGGNFSSIALGGLISGTGAGTVGITTLGINGYVLTANSGAPGGVAWTSPSTGGTVTSITCLAPLTCTPNPITATGSIAGATLVTSAASLAANQILLGGGLQATMALGSLGTTTTFLQGNSGGAPTWAAVNVGTSVTGTLTRANGGLNSSSVGTGILRDGTTPAASELSGDCATSGSNAVLCTKLNGQAVSLGGSFTMSGAFGFTGTLTAATSVTFPTSGTLTQTVCSGTIPISGLVTTGSHSDFTATCTGLLSTDNISLDFNGSPLGITGFIPSASGMLTVIKWPGVNLITVSAVNNTSSNITLGSTVTLNYRVFR